MEFTKLLKHIYFRRNYRKIEGTQADSGEYIVLKAETLLTILSYIDIQNDLLPTEGTHEDGNGEYIV